ncbi:MAG: DUF4043 family protein [Pseudohongiellaceae bacterium]
MAGNFTIGEVFYGRELTQWNAMQRWNMAMMAMPNEDSRLGFFSKHGMVEQTDIMQKSDAPIQMVRGLEGGGKQMTIYLRGFLSGEPSLVDADGYAPPDDNTRRTLPQTEFSFQCTEWYGPPLYSATFKQSADASTSIVGDYYQAISDYMANLQDELAVIVLSGFRGEGQTNRVFNRQNATPNQNAQSQVAGFTELMKQINAVNTITAPTRLFSGQSATLSPNAALNAAGFLDHTADFNLTLPKLTNMQAYRANQKQGYADWDLRPGTFTIMPDESNGEKVRKEGWTLIVSPEVARDMKNSSGTQNWYNHQIAVAAAQAYKTGIPTGVVGMYSDTTILEYERLSKYWAGASADVPVVRCLMMGAQSLVFGYQGKRMPEKFLPRGNNKMRHAIENWGTPFESWISGHDSERNASLQYCFNLGMKKVQFEGPNFGGLQDRGLIAWDFSFSGSKLYA